MSFRPCIVIPVYNHAGAIHRTVASVAGHGLPIYLTDDGSDAQTRRALDGVKAAFPAVHLARLPVNQGKGAAVLDAMRRAAGDGCTHALQIDADAQHDAADVPRFVALARAHPDAVISGQPIYDESVPRARLYGRYVTHFWVWVETLSFDIADALCGYRLYPLAPTLRLADRVSLKLRMDFDVAVIVRLYWTGVPVLNLPTCVTYPADGVSHFDVLRDNVRISRTHTRLFFGMLSRVPLLLARKAARVFARTPEGDTAHWSRTAERGTLVGLRILQRAYILMGRRVARAVMWPVVAYFFATGTAARHASLQYLRKLFDRCGPLPDLPRAPGLRDAFRHFQAFAESGLDKLAAWHTRGAELPVDFPALPELRELAASGRGAVLIGAHLGNLEMSRAVGASAGVPGINAVVYTDHARRFAAMLAEANDDYAVNLVQVSELGPDTAIALQEKIDRGELIFIVGDRTPASGNGRVSVVPFLGAPAAFAQGPLLIAHLLGCPVFLFFCLKDGSRYRIHLEAFAERIALPRHARDEALAGYIARYAARLEHYCRLAPLQWFNFFDFWRPATPRTLPRTSDERAQTVHA